MHEFAFVGCYKLNHDKKVSSENFIRICYENERMRGEELVMPEYGGMLQVFDVDMSRVTSPPAWF